MGKNLVIVESPTKAKTLKKFLGSEYEVQASMGHLRDLPKSKIGVDIEGGFKPVYEEIVGKEELIEKLRRMTAKAKTVYLAMDPDREGEAIAWHTAALLSEPAKGKRKSKKAFERVSFHEITKEAILEAMKKPGKVNMSMVDAQQARRVLDRLVGYNLSPVLWKKIRRGLSAGRVQSVALRLITEREIEIKAFKAQEYWIIQVELQKNGVFRVELFEIGGKGIGVRGQGTGDSNKTVYLDSDKVAKPVIDDLKKAVYTIEKVNKREKKRQPYAPYTTSTLQQAGANVLGWSGKRTMRVAQMLYEAGYITYHRTDSVNLASSAIGAVRTYIESEYGAKYLPDKAIFYVTKSKNAQEAHEAIRPTNASLASLANDEGKHDGLMEKLYKLIWRRFVACQMVPAVYDATTITVKAVGSHSAKASRGESVYRLRVSGSTVKFDGWRKVYGKAKSDDEEIELPEVDEGEKVKFVKLLDEQKFTEPPPRFNDASLVKELEKRGIGRPSTYASIISTLIGRGYMERLERRFYPSPVGMTVVPFLVENFKEIMGYDFTAEMEEDLDRIARGEKEWEKIMGVFWKPFIKLVKDVEKNAKRVGIPVEKTGTKCPTCKEGEVVIRVGRFGKFKSCSRFPECRYTASMSEELKGIKCPSCGGGIVTKKTKYGRMFYGCKNYPKCTYASWTDPRLADKEKTAKEGKKTKVSKKK